VASLCDMLSPVLDVPFHRMAAAKLALPSLVAQLVDMLIQAVCGHGSDQRPLSLHGG
jgi:hypothetical protein